LEARRSLGTRSLIPELVRAYSAQGSHDLRCLALSSFCRYGLRLHALALVVLLRSNVDSEVDNHVSEDGLADASGLFGVDAIVYLR